MDALHATRSTYEKAVCLSLKRLNCDNTEERSAQIFTLCETSFTLALWEEEWLVGRPLLREILGQADRVKTNSPLFGWYSLVAPQP